MTSMALVVQERDRPSPKVWQPWYMDESEGGGKELPTRTHRDQRTRDRLALARPPHRTTPRRGWHVLTGVTPEIPGRPLVRTSLVRSPAPPPPLAGPPGDGHGFGTAREATLMTTPWPRETGSLWQGSTRPPL
ncbi:hypothetical protein C7M84_000676 [Penaeus vannamei]|uniref:Uncharacterized protein n=1 Tax=Penaeus vannamei TaxID=6689 RepID=A0A423TVU6_PENVA|nr:hypothetical protein C7M84_000676 [Penaeus vannamei]